MDIAITYALLSLCFAGMNDVVFKRYSMKDRSRGAIVFGIGVVWALLQGFTLWGKGGALHLDPVTLGYGLAAGAMLALSNLLLIESLTHIEVSLGATIYRLNTIGVVLLSILLLHESPGPLNLLGIGVGVVAVLLLARKPTSGKGAALQTGFVWLAIAASGLRALYGVTSKAGLNQGADTDTMLLVAALCWIAGGFLYARLREGRFRLTPKKALYALVSGMLVHLIVYFLLAAMQQGQASIVIPIANLSFVVALLISVAVGMERLSPRKLAAIGCASASIWLLALPP
jgi:drug/metabolite transporter (DMT)-like permease